MTVWILRAKSFAGLVVHDGNCIRTFPTKEDAEAYLVARILEGQTFQLEFEAVTATA